MRVRYSDVEKDAMRVRYSNADKNAMRGRYFNAGDDVGRRIRTCSAGKNSCRGGGIWQGVIYSPEALHHPQIPVDSSVRRYTCHKVAVISISA